ncbi:MAG: Gfo/Idh/MocA family oxidoreductase [Lentisphaerae bacterium]|jgi:predicted dehydrogenase|nr:Gfo/Idh/MocA family oxidoreductase [Lentisphaerota bacterium]MBT4819026.1 Gfo/Idh/MocA family oxidoreductase [Lentisphaerota bacterium]MBT5612105.1 Gfo/Idh/MocA family oxidoreductase [Lentisphaerota bacterium]MBT7056894.1 Gfo/Idh/MocA family oxidoreductase [Lentisphaerota bacterium]
MKRTSSASLSRRAFLRAATAASTAPVILPSSLLGADDLPSPSERIVMGLIGVGGQGSYHMRTLSGFPDVQIAAICDVDAGHLDRAVDHVENAYSERRKSGTFKGCARYNDFRDLIARPDIDAVLVATPDHWHAAIGIAAMKAGKDCYIEKPLSLTVEQGRRVCDVARRYRRVVQVGSHERSRANARFACELVRNGRIGKLHTIRVNMPMDAGQKPIPPQPVMPVPEGLDWNMWLGPAPWAPYTEKRCHFSFRYILDYSGGEMTDRGAHILDLAQLALDMDDSGPVELAGTGWRPEDGLFNTFMRYEFSMRYGNGVQLLGSEASPRGIRFEGSDGWVFIHIHGGRLEASLASLLKEKLTPDEIHLGRSPGHHQDFLNAVRTRGTPMATPEIGHRTATLCHLLNAAMLTGQRLEWDPAAERVTNSEEANRLLSRPARPPWPT